MNLADIPMQEEAPTVAQSGRLEKGRNQFYFRIHRLVIAGYVGFFLTPVAWLVWRLLEGKRDVYEIGIPVIICVLILIITVAARTMASIAQEGRAEESQFPQMHVLPTKPESTSADKWLVPPPPAIGPIRGGTRRT